MKYDESIHSMREFIHYDFTSKFASESISIEKNQQDIEKYNKQENDLMHMKHRKETIDIWANIT